MLAFSSFKGGKFADHISARYLSFAFPFVLLVPAYALSQGLNFLLEKTKKFLPQKIFVLLTVALPLVAILLFVYAVEKKSYVIMVRNYHKTGWTKPEKYIYDLVQKKPLHIIAKVDHFGSHDPTSKLYLDVIPKQRNYNITTHFVARNKDVDEIKFTSEEFNLWKDGKIELLLLTDNSKELPYDIGLFEIISHNYGSPPITIRRLRPPNTQDAANAESLQKLFYLNGAAGDLDFAEDLVANGRFKKQLKAWNYWQNAKTQTNNIVLLRDEEGVRILNPEKKLIGLAQTINIKSGTVYRLEGKARCQDEERPPYWGARLALFAKGQKEIQVIWSKASPDWMSKSIVFTNRVEGTGVIFIHMGYGQNASSGDFTDIRLFPVSE